MNVTEKQSPSSSLNSASPLSPELITKKSSSNPRSVSFHEENKEGHEVTFLRDLKKKDPSFFSSTNSSHYFDVPEGPADRPSLGRQSSVSENEFKDCLPVPEKKGEQKRSIKKVNPRAEMTSVVHQVNLKTEQLLRSISNTLNEAKRIYLKTVPPLEKSYSNLKWEEGNFDPFEGKLIISRHQVRVPMKRSTPQSISLTEEEKNDLNKIIIKTKQQLEKAKELNQQAEGIIAENHLSDCREAIVSTSKKHFNQFPELELDLRELQLLLDRKEEYSEV